ncbi:hypothetical protein Tco_1243473 [Tanacetum coccineum]
MLGRKRAVKEQQKESSKKLKVEEEKESEEVEEDDEVELKKLLHRSSKKILFNVRIATRNRYEKTWKLLLEDSEGKGDYLEVD